MQLQSGGGGVGEEGVDGLQNWLASWCFQLIKSFQCTMIYLVGRDQKLVRIGEGAKGKLFSDNLII